jgi:menaquinone-dependent protoporphyrinogen oxidase
VAKIGVFYHSVEGQTEKIAYHIVETAAAEGMEADLARVVDAPPKLGDYDAIVVGGSVHAGKHHKELKRFVKLHLAELAATPSAFFSVSLSAAEEDEESQVAVHRIADGFLAETGWKPQLVALFGGALAYTRYGFVVRHVMKRISKHHGGPTDTSRDYEMTDWAAVEDFARDIVALASHRQEQPATA